MSDRWDTYFLGLALSAAGMSKDPNTQYGAVIIGPDREPRTSGFNGFPRGIADSLERLSNREVKNKLMVHAEHNAILSAARIGVSISGCTLYFVGTDSSGMIWGGAPCVACTLAAIQAGIKEIVSYPWKPGPSQWTEDVVLSKACIEEAASITRREVPLPGTSTI